MNAFKYALTLYVLSAACAELPDDADSSEDALSPYDESKPPLALKTCPSPAACSANALPYGYDQIHAELAQIDAAVRARFFARETGVVTGTPDGRAQFQWFYGSDGRGAIYNVSSVVSNVPSDARVGTFHIYGPILEEWARRDFERGLGYFTSPSELGSRTSQVFGVSQEFLPSIANGGLLRTRTVLNSDGASVQYSSQSEYLVSPGSTSLQPQQCTILQWSLPAYDDQYKDNYIVPEDSYDGFIGDQNCICAEKIWCGSVPPPSEASPHP